MYNPKNDGLYFPQLGPSGISFTPNELTIMDERGKVSTFVPKYRIIKSTSGESSPEGDIYTAHSVFVEVDNFGL